MPSMRGNWPVSSIHGHVLTKNILLSFLIEHGPDQEEACVFVTTKQVDYRASKRASELSRQRYALLYK